jgi:molecular chaperone HscB
MAALFSGAASPEMIDPTRNHFDLFGLPERYRFDAAALERAYRALQSEVHPDRFAGGSDAQKRAALQSSAHVNEAYRALRDPVARAAYLLALHGIDAQDETDTALPLAFLERQLERREVAEEALAARDVRALSSLIDEIRAEAADREAALVHTLDDERAYAVARTGVRELQFLTKLAADVDVLQAALDD